MKRLAGGGGGIGRVEHACGFGRARANLQFAGAGALSPPRSATLLCAAAFSAALSAANPAASDPLVLATGKPIELDCDSQAVVVAPEAATTKGTLRVRLEAKEPLDTSSWTVADIAIAHTGSFAARHKGGCAGGCTLTVAKDGPFELWAPKRVSPGAMAPGEALSVATIDPATLKLRASTFIDKDIAALEQGECKVVP